MCMLSNEANYCNANYWLCDDCFTCQLKNGRMFTSKRHWFESLTGLLVLKQVIWAVFLSATCLCAQWLSLKKNWNLLKKSNAVKLSACEQYTEVAQTHYNLAKLI